MKIDFSKYIETFEEKMYFTREDYAVLAMLYSYGIRQSQNENKSMLECCSFFDKGPQMSNTPEQDAELHSLRSYWLKQVTAATQFVLLSFTIDLLNKKCVFYDMPVKGEPIKEKKMSPELADLYKPYIESGEAVDEVKNLVCIGEMSFANLQDMISACVEYDAKCTQIKNIVERSSLIKEKPRSK